MSRRAALLWLTALGLAASGVIFHQRQAAGALGGAISIPKQLWLCYTLFAWFALPIAFALSPELPRSLRRVYQAHLAWWGFRAVVEMWMLYVSISWSPLYGISHDLIAIVLLSWFSRSVAEDRDRGWARFGRRWIDAIRLALVPEIIFAAWFRHLNEGRAGIYFADDSARFAALNHFTLLVVIVVYTHLAWCVGQVLLERNAEPIDARG